jgi:hypothetical protein
VVQEGGAPLKLVQIHYHFEFSESVEKILEQREVGNFVRYPMVAGKDRDGKHDGSKVYPGRSSVVQALVANEQAEELLADLESFKSAERSHQHLVAVVVPVEAVLE